MGKNSRSIKSRSVSGRHIVTVLISLFVITGGIALYRLISIETGYTAAQDEYEELRQYTPERISSPDWIESTPGPANPEPSDTETEPLPDTRPDLSAINPDYVGWIRIHGTVIDYPVVQGTDNVKYLNTTFRGERNSSGTIFIDSGCQADFTGFTLVHGHNMRDGSMFTELNSFYGSRSVGLEILIYTKNSELLSFSIFDVIKVDHNNSIFDLPGRGVNDIANYFAAYGITTQDMLDGTDILVLATCTDSSRTERLLVFAKGQRIESADILFRSHQQHSIDI